MESDKITKRQIQDVNRLYHILFFIYGSCVYLSDKLKNMTPVDLTLINEVAKNPDPVVKEIKERLDIPPSTLSSAINRLEERGLIKRLINTKDRRSFRLELTDKGEEIQSEHLRIDRLGACKVLESLDTYKNREEFIRLISMIIERMDQSEKIG